MGVRVEFQQPQSRRRMQAFCVILQPLTAKGIWPKKGYKLQGWLAPPRRQVDMERVMADLIPMMERVGVLHNFQNFRPPDSRGPSEPGTPGYQIMKQAANLKVGNLIDLFDLKEPNGCTKL